MLESLVVPMADGFVMLMHDPEQPAILTVVVWAYDATEPVSVVDLPLATVQLFFAGMRVK